MTLALPILIIALGAIAVAYCQFRAGQPSEHPTHWGESPDADWGWGWVE